MQSADQIIPVVEAHVDRHAWTPWGRVSVVPAALGDDAAVLGMGCLVERHVEAAASQHPTVATPHRMSSSTSQEN
jgi:hypothetical protein